jgi:hypothetical protein
MLLPYRHNGQEGFLIHQEDEDSDWLWVDPPESVPTFATAAALQDYSERSGLSVSGTYPGKYDLDLIEAWLPTADTTGIKYSQFVYAWGLFDTLAASVGALLRASSLSQPIYQHLWIGIYAEPNIVPDWLPGEVAYLTAQMRWGLELFRTHTHPAD